MMKPVVFSILMVAILATTHQTVADEIKPECLVKGSPWVDDVDHLYVRDTNNRLREWRRVFEDGEARWKVNNLLAADQDTKIMSDPVYFREFDFKWIERFDNEGNPVFFESDAFSFSEEEFNPVGVVDISIEHIIARGQRGHLLECKQQRSRVSEIVQVIYHEEGHIEEIYEVQTEETPWQWSDLTENAEGGRPIAGTVSIPLPAQFARFWNWSLGSNSTPPKIFTPTPDDRLLIWSLPPLSDEYRFLEESRTLENNLVWWSVKDLTTSTEQSSAGNSNVVVLDPLSSNNINIFTRSRTGHLLMGWQFFEPEQEEEQEEELLDLTALVDKRPIIIGDPTGYGILPQVDVNKILGLQYVFARGLNNHLLAWRHLWEWEGEIPEDEKEQLQTWLQVWKEWREAMRHSDNWRLLDLTEKAEGGKTIAGDPIFYLEFQRDQDKLSVSHNVLARSDEDHLLKWSVSDLSAQPEDAGLIFDENRRWVVEDLTDEVVGGKLIKGEPKRAYGTQQQREIPEGGISSSLEWDEVYVLVEKIFVTDQNGHLLEWQRRWKNEEIELEDGTTIWERIPVDDWQVTDLIEGCQYVDEETGQESRRKPKCTISELSKKNTDPKYSGPCNSCDEEELERKKSDLDYICRKNR
jgi:hypothetical protein